MIWENIYIYILRMNLFPLLDENPFEKREKLIISFSA